MTLTWNGLYDVVSACNCKTNVIVKYYLLTNNINLSYLHKTIDLNLGN